MTLIVGILCSDGVVIGTDGAATFGLNANSPTISQEFRGKIEIIDGRVIVAGTGAIGLGQRFEDIVQQQWTGKKLVGMSDVQIARTLSRLTIQDFSQTMSNIQTFGALVAMPCKNKPTLIEFPVADSHAEVKTDTLWYASMGSGQIVADPLLGFVRATFWENDAPPSRQEGIFAATMVLKLGCKMAPYGVSEPIQMAVLERASARNADLVVRSVTDDELAGHVQNVDNALEHFREYRNILRGKSSGVAVQPLPTPPSS